MIRSLVFLRFSRCAPRRPSGRSSCMPRRSSSRHGRTTVRPRRRSRPAPRCARCRATSSRSTRRSLVPAQDGTAAFCRVQGQVQPEVRFEVSLPSAWNGRLYMFGNGGFAGESLSAGNRTSAAEHGGDEGLRRRPDQHRSRCGPRAAGDVREPPAEADRLRLPRRARHGDDRQDARARLLRRAPRTRLFRRLLDRRPPGPDCGAAFPRRLRRHRRRRAGARLRRHDDALRDHPSGAVGGAAVRGEGTPGRRRGLQEVRRRRRRDRRPDHGSAPVRVRSGNRPAALRYAKEGQACVSDADVASLAAIYGGVVVEGTPAVSRFSSRERGVRGDAGRASKRLGSVARYEPANRRCRRRSWKRSSSTWPRREAKSTGAAFDVDRDLPKLEAISTLLNATDADLGPFRTRGGRILMYYGWADPALNPMMGVEYYERVCRRWVRRRRSSSVSS